MLVVTSRKTCILIIITSSHEKHKSKQENSIIIHINILWKKTSVEYLAMS